MNLEEKKAILNKIREQLKQNDKVIKNYMREIKLLKRRERTKKLIIAGSLFEKAGILENYNPEEILSVLRQLDRSGMKNESRENRENESEASQKK